MIRRLEEKDAKRFGELLKNLDAENDHMIRKPGEYRKSVEETAEAIARMNAVGIVAGIFGEGDLVGYYKLTGSSKFRLSHKRELTIGVVKEHQNRGYGNRLMTDAMVTAEAMNLRKVDLKVAITNVGAIRLYERHGFVKTGYYEKDLRLDEDNYLDFIHMTRLIK